MYECSKHGPLPESSVIYIDIVNEDKGVKIMEKNRFCLKCVADYFNALQRQGMIGRLTETNPTN